MINSVTFWIGAVILYLTIGYQIARASLRVYPLWGKVDRRDNIYTSFMIRLILYPGSSIDILERKNIYCYGWIRDVELQGKEGLYVALNMFLWPARIILFLFVIAIACVVSPLLTLLWVIFRQTVEGLILFIKGLFANSSPTTPAPVESKTAPIE